MISDTELRDIGTDRGHNPRNLVTKHRRRWNDIVSSEKQVGVTQPGRSHLDKNFGFDHRITLTERDSANSSIELNGLQRR